jgi:hypothetical protein
LTAQAKAFDRMSIFMCAALAAPLIPQTSNLDTDHFRNYQEWHAAKETKEVPHGIDLKATASSVWFRVSRSRMA